MRLDVLLHELRLFKSRSQASAAIEAGWVWVGGAPAKASRAVRVGERITLRPPSRTGPPRVLEVLELPARSLTKEAARQLVREVPPSETDG
jgi:ribosome-associated heat shock protein Hsp15